MERQKADQTARIERVTAETSIELILNVNGSGQADIKTGIGFFDHMLTAFAQHSQSDLIVRCTGDLHVDGHHTVEDVGICLGRALAQVTADKRGMARYGHAVVPMDEALVECALDFSNRSYLGLHQMVFPQTTVGEYDACLTPEFFRAVVNHAGLTLHMRCLAGENSHHIIEASFKAFARACAAAWQRNQGSVAVLSTKGVL
jgi:imidazoleglycerol-phosphate dehydratase